MSFEQYLREMNDLEAACLASKIRHLFNKQCNSLKPPRVMVSSHSQPSLMGSLIPDKPHTYQLLNDIVQ